MAEIENARHAERQSAEERFLGFRVQGLGFGLYRGYIGTILGLYIGIVEKKMQATIV